MLSCAIRYWSQRIKRELATTGLGRSIILLFGSDSEFRWHDSRVSTKFALIAVKLFCTSEESWRTHSERFLNTIGAEAASEPKAVIRRATLLLQSVERAAVLLLVWKVCDQAYAWLFSVFFLKTGIWPTYCHISSDLDKILHTPIVVRNTLVGRLKPLAAPTVSMSVCLSVCTFVYLFSVSMIVLSTVVSCCIGGQLWWVFLSGSLPTVECNLTLICYEMLVNKISIYLSRPNQNDYVFCNTCNAP